MIYCAGLDLGQAQDYSALAILEVEGTLRLHRTDWGREERLEGLPITRMACRHLERFALQTKYVDICSQVRTRLKGLRFGRLPAESYLAVDRTGVGRGPFELLAPLNPIGVTITAGDQVQPGENIRDWKVPKRDLVSGVQVALQNGVLTIAGKLPMAEVLVKELLNFRVKISAEGHDSYNAWRESDHDDLVLAVAIAAWTAQQLIALTAQIGLAKIQQDEVARRSVSEFNSI